MTMTGELADTFVSRAEGVDELSRLAARELVDGSVLLYAGRAGFVSLDHADEHIEDIASANWHASAALVARRQGDALFVDMGSTTTDIVPVAGRKIVARGYTDAERLVAGELVYTGLVRSFVMAVAERAPIAGHWTTLIKENFANMADAHRVLGALPEDADQMMTADGREKTVAASQARLARIVGRDVVDADDATWSLLAQWFAEAQIRAVTDGAFLVLSQVSLPAHAPIVGAGIGAAVLGEVARRLGRPYVDFETLLDIAPEARQSASQCAPAAALAALASMSSPP